MKYFLLLICCWAVAIPDLLAHVGSPNVFFEGKAGPNPVRIVIRPPPALPGMAQVDVRSEGDITDVALRASLWEAGRNAAPEAVHAVSSPADRNFFHATLWLLRDGSYDVTVTVTSGLGCGSLHVPVNSGSFQRPKMPPALGAVLATLGVGLFAGMVRLAGAVARDSLLEPGTRPGPRDLIRGRDTMLVAAVLLCGAVYAGALRWQAMDREFQSTSLYEPLPISATVRTSGTLWMLRMTPGNETAGDPRWDRLVTDHGKLMHLFLVREPDSLAFAHIHPVRRDSRTFEAILPPLPAGAYALYGEVTRQNGSSQTLTAHVTLAAPLGLSPALPSLNGPSGPGELFCGPGGVFLPNAVQPTAQDPDDSWHLSAEAASEANFSQTTSLLPGGGWMVLQHPGDLVENQETSLHFTVFGEDGRRATLRPYMGMQGHLALRRADGKVFAHLHPGGSISMAAEELFVRREQEDAWRSRTNSFSATPPFGSLSAPPLPSGADTSEVAFPYAFPQPGEYRIWVQVRCALRVVTGAFNVRVQPTR